MCPKKFLTKKDFCPEKFFVQKYFESKKIVSPKKKLLKHFFFLQSFVLHQKTFGSKKLLGPKTNLVQKKSLVQNKFWYQKFLGPKNFYLKMICGQFWVKKNSGLLGIRVKWGGWGYLYLIIQLLDISEAYIPNLSPLVCLEPFKKFSVGGWVVVDTTVNIVFCFGPRLGLKTEVWAQAEHHRFQQHIRDFAYLFEY